VKVVNRKSQKMEVDHLQFRHRHPIFDTSRVVSRKS